MTDVAALRERRMAFGKHFRIRIIAAAAISGFVLAAAEKPAAVDDALEVVSAARRAVSTLPVLTGTEGFDVDAFRQLLEESRSATPYQGFITAEAVVTVANTGGTSVERLTLFNVGWTALEVNWLFATLLGNSADARTLLAESNLLVNYESLYMANIEQGGAFVSFYPRIEANGFAMTLRRTASELNSMMLLPNAIDPEGFLRQRLQATFNRLTNAAEYIHNAGEAFSFF